MNVSCGNIGMLYTLGFIFRTFADLRFFFVDLKRWMTIFLLLGSDGALGGVHTTAKTTATATVTSRFAVHTSRFVPSPSP